MSAQLYVVDGIVAGRVWSAQDRALLRTVELSRPRRRPRRWGRRAR
ncbi:MAG: hypothetical protein R2731_04725 [Nocardioides sp.]